MNTVLRQILEKYAIELNELSDDLFDVAEEFGEKQGFNKLLREMVVISPPPGFLLIGLLVKNTSCLIFIL